MRRIYKVREMIPVAGLGPMMLLCPKWRPAFMPHKPIELFAGLTLTEQANELAWKRHLVTVTPFLVNIPMAFRRSRPPSSFFPRPSRPKVG